MKTVCHWYTVWYGCLVEVNAHLQSSPRRVVLTQCTMKCDVVKSTLVIKKRRDVQLFMSFTRQTFETFN